MAYTPKMPRKRSRRKKKKDELTVLDWVKIVLFVVVSAALVSVFIFLKADIGNVADDYGRQASDLNGGKANSKSQFNKQFEYANEKKQEENQLANQNGNKGSNASVINGTLTAKEDGELITDTTLNPSGIPYYDGWTLNLDKLKAVAGDLGVNSDDIIIWDTIYEDYWNTDDYKDNPGLYGLGDFTNSKAGSKNMIPGGSQASNTYVSRATKIPTNKGSIASYDNRICMAVSYRIFTNPNRLTDDVISKLTDAKGNTIASPLGSGHVGWSYGVYENQIVNITSVTGETRWKGLYFDVLFDDGTVIPGIICDAKGIHVGQVDAKLWSDDMLMSGVGQVKFSEPNYDKIGYQTILEIYCPGFQNNGLDINLNSKKIVGIRSYYVASDSSNNYAKWKELQDKK